MDRERRYVGDGIVRETVLQPHEGKLYVHDYSINDAIIARRNAALRSSGAAKSEVADMRLMATIPKGVWIAAVKQNPDLESPDMDIKRKARIQWLKGPGRIWTVRNEI